MVSTPAPTGHLEALKMLSRFRYATALPVTRTPYKARQSIHPIPIPLPPRTPHFNISSVKLLAIASVWISAHYYLVRVSAAVVAHTHSCTIDGQHSRTNRALRGSEDALSVQVRHSSASHTHAITSASVNPSHPHITSRKITPFPPQIPMN